MFYRHFFSDPPIPVYSPRCRIAWPPINILSVNRASNAEASEILYKELYFPIHIPFGEVIWFIRQSGVQVPYTVIYVPHRTLYSYNQRKH